MASFVYNTFKKKIGDGTIDWDAAASVIRCLLERSTSTYTPDKDHDFLDDFTGGGGVEIDASGYSRQTLGTKSVTVDNTNDRASYDAADVSFGSIASGQTIKAIIVYLQVGGDDTTPADDVLIAYLDNASGLPLATNGNAVTFTLSTDGLLLLT